MLPCPEGNAAALENTGTIALGNHRAAHGYDAQGSVRRRVPQPWVNVITIIFVIHCINVKSAEADIIPAIRE